jgi:hypothetical protein
VKAMVILFLAVSWIGVASAQVTDGQHLSEAQYALSQKDCRAASGALGSVSPAFAKDNPVWNYTAAQVTECLKQYGLALTFYQQYDQLVPGQPEITKKIGEMLYLQKQQAQANAANAQKNEDDEARSQAQNAAAAKAQALLSAQRNLQTNLNRFGNFTYDHQDLRFHYALRSTVQNCQLETTETITSHTNEFSFQKTETETTPLAEVNPDSIDSGEPDSDNLIQGSYFYFSLAGGAEHIRHVDRTESSEDRFKDHNSTHVDTARYFADSSSNRDTVSESFKAAVLACQK